MPGVLELPVERRNQFTWEHGSPILLTLAIPNCNLQPLEIQILHPQAQAFG